MNNVKVSVLQAFARGKGIPGRGQMNKAQLIRALKPFDKEILKYTKRSAAHRGRRPNRSRRQSVRRGPNRSKSRSVKRRRSKALSVTKKKLYAKAKKHNIPGRSTMNKAQLIRALKKV